MSHSYGESDGKGCRYVNRIPVGITHTENDHDEYKSQEEFDTEPLDRTEFWIDERKT